MYYNILKTLKHLKDEDIYEKDKYDSKQHFILFHFMKLEDIEMCLITI